MPEDDPPPGVQGGSLDLALFMTLTVAIDYQRDADALWKALERSLPTPRPDTCSMQPRYIGGTEEGSRGLVEIRRFQKNRGTAAIFGGPSRSRSTRMEGNPSSLGDYGWDAVTLFQRLSTDTRLVAGHAGPDYRYLRGPRIDPLWLRILSDNVGLSIQRFGRRGNSNRCSHCMCLVGDRNRPG